MSIFRVARHLGVRSRMAHRRMRQVLMRTTTPQALGKATAVFAAISLLSHVVITWSVVTASVSALPDAANDSLVTTRFLYPLMQQRPQPVQEHVRFVGVGGGAVAAAPISKATGERAAEQGAPIDVATAAAPLPEAPASEPVEAYTELEVDLAAERDPDSEGPSYPDSLLARQIEGAARVRFVVDSTGHADERSFAVIETNRAEFADAVRLALPRMKFKPASIGTKPVAMSVEQTFLFRITRPPPLP
jgi:TonB family protein